MTSIPTAVTVSFVLVQENLHLWKVEGQHRLCHAGAGGHDREVRSNGDASGGVPATGGGRQGYRPLDQWSVTRPWPFSFSEKNSHKYRN